MRAKPDPAACRAAAADMAAFDSNLAEQARREERENLKACAISNVRNSESQEREKLAVIRRQNQQPAALTAGSTAKLELADKGANGARRLTPTEEDEMHAERTAARLAHFGGKAGKHGPLAAVKIAVMLRIPRAASLALGQIASDTGSSTAALLTQLAVIASKCDPENWYAAVVAFQGAANSRPARR